MGTYYAMCAPCLSQENKRHLHFLLNLFLEGEEFLEVHLDISRSKHCKIIGYDRNHSPVDEAVTAYQAVSWSPFSMPGKSE
jgi:hypothetical protein